jgi:hypothetical protein
MCLDGRGNGLLKSSDRRVPTVSVVYEISHHQSGSGRPNGLSVVQKVASVRIVDAEDGKSFPLGDYDLLVGSEIVRLKHVAEDPKWLVLSSTA